jgi:pimeloyl-ACP methyl ester carboxylesterase
VDKYAAIPAAIPAASGTSTPHTLFYRDTGSGHPVLLLHGFGEDGTVWDNQPESLSAACRLIIPDLPGSGRSSALTTPLSIEELATVIRDFLNQLNIHTCTLIGHSMGGYIALAFAALYPERLSAFGLFHSTAYPDSEDKKNTRRKAIDFIRTSGSAPFIRQSTPNLFSPSTRAQRPGLIEAAITKYSGFPPDSLVAYYEAMIARPDRTDVLRQFSRPVLFVVGEDDTVIPLQQALEQCYLPSISHLHIIKRTGHQAMLEDPQKSNGVLLEFINFTIQSFVTAS